MTLKEYLKDLDRWLCGQVGLKTLEIAGDPATLKNTAIIGYIIAVGRPGILHLFTETGIHRAVLPTMEKEVESDT